MGDELDEGVQDDQDLSSDLDPSGGDDGGGDGDRGKGGNEALVALQKELADLKKANEDYKKDIEAHKGALAAERERLAGIGTALGGSIKTKEQIEEEKLEKAVQARVQKLFPGIDKLPDLVSKLDSGGGEKQVSLSDQKYFVDAWNDATERAAKMGFSTKEGRDAVAMLGDLFINNVDVWKDRFYKKGQSTAVMGEVHDYLEKRVFGPYAKGVEARFLAKLRKQGLLTREPREEHPVETGPKKKPPLPPPDQRRQRKEEPDYNDPRQRNSALDEIVRSVNSGSEE